MVENFHRIHGLDRFGLGAGVQHAGLSFRYIFFHFRIYRSFIIGFIFVYPSPCAREPVTEREREKESECLLAGMSWCVRRRGVLPSPCERDMKSKIYCLFGRCVRRNYGSPSSTIFIKLYLRLTALRWWMRPATNCDMANLIWLARQLFLFLISLILFFLRPPFMWKSFFG